MFTEHDAMSRRSFLQGTAAVGVATLAGMSARAADQKIRLGVIGNGNRGTWIVNLFQQHGGFEIVSAADYFDDRVTKFGDQFNIPANRRFTGLNAYKRLLETDVDAVAIESPPYFHPEQAAASVDAGKHTYLAKPIAVDVPGCQTVEASGERATQNNLAFLIDFQTRTNAFYQEAIRRVHAGEIGPVLSGESTYHAGPTWNVADHLREAPNDPDHRIRAWGLDRELSGDIITEQNIHTLDVASWIMDAAPVKAVGHGGRMSRDIGTTWDSYSCVYTFPNNALVSFFSKQFGAGHGGILCRMYGPDGTIDTDYFGKVEIRGKKYYAGGATGNLYTDGAVANIATFYDQIANKDYSNTTVDPSVRSNLTTILGRTAAYEGGEVTWDEMMKNAERFDPKLKGAKA